MGNPLCRTKSVRIAFRSLKGDWSTHQIWLYQTPLVRFVVYCGALKNCLGCVLMQEGKVVGYLSRKLRIHGAITLLMTWS